MVYVTWKKDLTIQYFYSIIILRILYILFIWGDFIMINKSINFSKRLPIVPAYKSDEFIKRLNQSVISKETIKQFKVASNKM